MYVRCTLLRRNGRRLADTETPPTVEGMIHQVGSRLEIRRPLDMNSPPAATLYAFELVAIEHFRLVLRGFEAAGGAGVLQSWQIEVLPWYGCDSTGRPLGRTDSY